MRSKQKQTTTPSDDEPTMTNVNHILRATIDNSRSIVQIAPELVVRIDEDVHDDQRNVAFYLDVLNKFAFTLCLIESNVSIF